MLRKGELLVLASNLHYIIDKLTLIYGVRKIVNH